MAERHIRLWDWFDRLQLGVKPDAAVECWPRGGAKSTTVELCVTRLICAARRRFILYVSGTQDQANKHLGAISESLEALGVGRAVNAYGQSRGWRQDYLRAESGCNALAAGLDVGLRGIKQGRLRPDLIVLDDIDDIEDTPEAVAKKLRQITRTILPAGSPDCAVVFVQNKIHANSVMAQMLDGRAPLLRRRNDILVIPAIYDLQLDGDKIVGGRPSWEGQSIALCQRQIEEWGLSAFLVEAQHDTREGSQVFLPEFRPVRDGRSWHVIDPEEEPVYTVRVGGLDYGSRSPFCHLSVGIDVRGGLVVTHEIYQRGLESSAQAKIVRDHVEGLLGKGKHRGMCIIADTAMFPARDPRERLGKAEIEDYWEQGLHCIPAVKDRIAGWNRLREFMATVLVDEQGREYPALRVVGARAPNLLREIDLAVSSKTAPDDLETSCPDHALDTIRYVAMSRPRPRALPTEPVIDMSRAPRWYVRAHSAPKRKI